MVLHPVPLVHLESVQIDGRALVHGDNYAEETRGCKESKRFIYILVKSRIHSHENVTVSARSRVLCGSVGRSREEWKGVDMR